MGHSFGIPLIAAFTMLHAHLRGLEPYKVPLAWPLLGLDSFHPELESILSSIGVSQ